MGYRHQYNSLGYSSFLKVKEKILCTKSSAEVRSVYESSSLIFHRLYRRSRFSRTLFLSFPAFSKSSYQPVLISCINPLYLSRLRFSTDYKNQKFFVKESLKSSNIFHDLVSYWEDCKAVHRCMPDPDEELEEILEESEKITAENVLKDSRQVNIDYKAFTPQDYVLIVRDAFEEWRRSFNPDYLEEDGGLDKIGKRYAEKYKLDINFVDKSSEERELSDITSPLNAIVNAANEEEIDKQVRKWKDASPFQISPEEEAQERERLLKELRKGGKHIKRLAENRISLLNESVGAFMEGYQEGRYENQEELKKSVSDQIEKFKSILESTDFSPESFEQKRAESIKYLQQEFTKRYDGIFDEEEQKKIDEELQRLVKEFESANSLSEIYHLEDYVDKLVNFKKEQNQETKDKESMMNETFAENNIKKSV